MIGRSCTSAPDIIMGRLSSTGQTIKVEYGDDNYRLRTEEVLGDYGTWRGPYHFLLYTKDLFNKIRKRTHPEGPGTVEPIEEENLPEPTHRCIE